MTYELSVPLEFMPLNMCGCKTSCNTMSANALKISYCAQIFANVSHVRMRAVKINFDYHVC